jgi:hypothetical protein
MDDSSSAQSIQLASPDTMLAAVPTGEVREIVLSKLVSEVYGEAEPSLRARLLGCLLRPVRPLGLVAVAAGAFSGFLHREHSNRCSPRRSARWRR